MLFVATMNYAFLRHVMKMCFYYGMRTRSVSFINSELS